MAVKELLVGHDVMAILPAGFGKRKNCGYQLLTAQQRRKSRWYFCRGKEADFAFLLQVRPRKTFRIKKDQKNRSKQADNCPKQDGHKQAISRMFISQTTYSEDSIYKRRNCNLKSKSSFTKVKRIIPEKINMAIQYRHKKLCTKCQDQGEMKPLLKSK